jgi:hypothetical protein
MVGGVDDDRRAPSEWRYVPAADVSGDGILHQQVFLSQDIIRYPPPFVSEVLLWSHRCSTKAFEPMLSLNSTYSSGPTANMVVGEDMARDYEQGGAKEVEQCDGVMV